MFELAVMKHPTTKHVARVKKKVDPNYLGDPAERQEQIDAHIQRFLDDGYAPFEESADVQQKIAAFVDRSTN